MQPWPCSTEPAIVKLMKEAPSKPFERVIFVCCNEREDGKASCAPRGAEEVREALKRYVKEKNLKKRVRVCRSMCLDLCSLGPNVCVMPDNVWLHDVKAADVPEIIRTYVDPLAPP